MSLLGLSTLQYNIYIYVPAIYTSYHKHSDIQLYMDLYCMYLNVGCNVQISNIQDVSQWADSLKCNFNVKLLSYFYDTPCMLLPFTACLVYTITIQLILYMCAIYFVLKNRI